MNSGTKIMTFLIIAIALVGSVMAGTNGTLVTSGSSLEAELLTYSPVPAQPGDLLDVWIQVSNDGGSASKSGTVTILPAYPFITEGSGEDVKPFPSIPSQSSFLVKTSVRIDKNANEGDNVLKIQVRENGNSDAGEYDLHISIKGRTNALSIEQVTTRPEKISPGDEATISIKVKNVGETLLRNVDVSLTLADLSLAPTISSNAMTIGSLSGGESATLTFGVIAFPAAEANAYQLPVTLTYVDEEDNQVTQSKTIGVVIGSAPELLVYLERNELSKESLQGDVVIKFINKGLSEIKLLEMEILESEDVQVVSESNIVYVGNIDTDDYESADITLKVKKEETSLPIKVSYRDALNKQYEETISLNLDAKNGNGNGGGSAFVWIALIVIVVIIVGVWFWRRSKQKPRK